MQVETFKPCLLFLTGRCITQAPKESPSAYHSDVFVGQAVPCFRHKLDD